MKKSENGTIENNEDSDSLFSDLLDARARRVKEEPAASDSRVCHPRCFCVKCVEPIENKGDSETAGTRCAQAYRRKGLKVIPGRTGGQ